MTATDELRALLDERGVEWTASDGEHVKETCWPYMGELAAAFAEYGNGTTRFACDTWCFTPAQAIAATLGRGTCRMVVDNKHRVDKVTTSWGCVCSACSGFHEFTHGEGWAFCPSCGRRVIDAGEVDG